MFEVTTWPRNTGSVLNELEALQDDMNRVFTDRWVRPGRATYPLMNIWGAGDTLVIDAEIPGVDPQDVDISVMDDELTIRGKAQPETPKEGEVPYRRERPDGEFTRTLKLPFRAEAGAVKATYKNGILRLTVPRSEAEKPRKITVEAA
jgi:HSP20 family protein